jgi:hypothetical protein
VNNEWLTRQANRDGGDTEVSDSEVSLVAYGRAGNWEVSVDEVEAGEAIEWYAQIVSPQVSIHARIPDPNIVREVLEFLKRKTPSEKPAARSLEIGSFASVAVELLRDTEFPGRFFVLIGNSGRSAIRFTIPPAEVGSLEQAIQQVIDELREDNLIS